VHGGSKLILSRYFVYVQCAGLLYFEIRDVSITLANDVNSHFKIQLVNRQNANLSTATSFGI